MTISRRDLIAATGGTALAAGTLAAAAAPALAQAQAGGSVLADVLRRGTLRFATIAGNPPYSSLGPDGKPAGYDIEAAQNLAAALKLNIEWTIVDVPGRIAALQTRRADATFANFTANVERSKVIAFTDPYVVVGSIYMVLANSKLQSVSEFNDPRYKVGYARGGTAEGIANSSAPRATKVRFDTVGDAFLALQSGQIDGHIQDSLQNASYLAQNPGKFKNLPGNWSYEEISVGLPAGDFDWWRVLNIWVKNFNGSGENRALFKKHFNYDMPPILQQF
jgi:polar amino acid transport system substrate-binding protein